MSTGARISFGVYDETAKPDAGWSSSRGQSWVDYGELKDDLTDGERYISGEPGVYLLDGSSRLFPDTPAGNHLGFWSSGLSGPDGAFTDPPILVCNFSSPHTSVGITIHFDGTTCLSDFTVRWLSSTALLSHVDVTGNTSQTIFIENHVDGYMAIQIIPARTDEPHRYVKIQEVDFGQKVVYDASALVSASVTEDADLSGGSVPANSLKFTVLDPNHRLNPVNPDGVYSYLKKGMPLNVEFLKDGTTYPGGVYYLDTWEGSNTGTAKMTATDCLGIEKEFESRFYSAISPADALAEIGAALGTETETGTLPVSTLCGYIPRVTAQEAIAHICLSSGGYARVTRDGRIRLEAMGGSPLVLESGAILGEPTVTQNQQPDNFEVEVHEYKVVDTGESVAVSFARRSWVDDLVTDTAYFFESQETGQKFQADVVPDIFLSGTAVAVYADRLEITHPNTSDMLCGYGNKPVTVSDPVLIRDKGTGTNTVSIKEIPYISTDNYRVVLDAVKAYYSRKLLVKYRTPWVPGMDCGARVSVPTRFGAVTGNISRMDIDLTGGLIATVEVIA